MDESRVGRCIVRFATNTAAYGTRYFDHHTVSIISKYTRLVCSIDKAGEVHMTNDNSISYIWRSLPSNTTLKVCQR